MAYQRINVGRALEAGNRIAAGEMGNVLNALQVREAVDQRNRRQQMRGAAQAAYVPGQGMDPKRFAEGLDKLGLFLEADEYRRGQRQDQAAQLEYALKSITAMQKVFGMVGDQQTYDLARKFLARNFPDHPITQKLPDQYTEDTASLVKGLSGMAQLERLKLLESAGQTRELKSGDELITQERTPEGGYREIARAPRSVAQPQKPTYKTDAEGNLLAITGTQSQPVMKGTPGQPARPGPYQNAIGLPEGGIGLPGTPSTLEPVKMPADAGKGPAEQQMIELIMEKTGMDFESAFNAYRMARTDPTGAVVQIMRIMADQQKNVLQSRQKSVPQMKQEAIELVQSIRQGFGAPQPTVPTAPGVAAPSASPAPLGAENDPLGVRSLLGY